VFTVAKKKLRRRLRKSSSRPGKAQTTGFIDTACNDFPVWRGSGGTERRITK
jgi:hypothetical protein